MWWLGWAWLDPVTSLLIGAVVAIGAFGLLRESFNAAMDAVPRTIDQAAVRAFLMAQPGFRAVPPLHIWSLGAGDIAMTAHLVRPEDAAHAGSIAPPNHPLATHMHHHHPTL